MKKLSVLFLSVAALATSLTSCSKDDDKSTPAPTAIEVTVKDNNGALASETIVSLYNASGKLVESKTTTGTGVVTFTKDLTSQKYIAQATKDVDCLIGVTQTTSVIELNKTTKLAVSMFEAGTLKVTNTKANTYGLKIFLASDETKTATLGVTQAAGSANNGNVYQTKFGTGNFILRAYQIDPQTGAIIEGGEVIEKTVTIEGCQTAEVTL